jgi:hypothetical protein
MASSSLPILFGGGLAGGIVILYGSRMVKQEWSGKAAAAGTGASSTAKNTTPPGAVGQVTSADLATIGAQHGWTGQQLTDWMNVINQESGGNPNAVNASSGASGIAQFIDGFGEYARYGGSANTVTGQLTAMANYIEQRYGNPSAAWAHEQANNWY